MSAIPPSLRERLRSTTGSDLPSPRDGKDFVLYVLRTAFRAASNPSLEVALRMASALGLPLVCVAVVEDGVTPGRSWRPTDRAAAFRLEALRELQPLFAARGTVLLVQHKESEELGGSPPISGRAMQGLMMMTTMMTTSPSSLVLGTAS